MLKNKFFIFGLILTTLFSGSSFAFDLEDYATNMRAARDAYLKAANELKLATGPFQAARTARLVDEKVTAMANGDDAAYAEAIRKETQVTECGL